MSHIVCLSRISCCQLWTGVIYTSMIFFPTQNLPIYKIPGRYDDISKDRYLTGVASSNIVEEESLEKFTGKLL